MRRAIESILLLACLAAACVFLYLRLLPVRRTGNHVPVSLSTWRVGSVPEGFNGSIPMAAESATAGEREVPEQVSAAVAVTGDAIPGEYVFSFYDEADMEAFAKKVSDSGGTVLDRMDFAHAVRIRVVDESMLERLTRTGPVPVEWSANRRVSLPPQAEPPLAGPDAYFAFGAEALSWLGVPNKHDKWGNGITVAVLDTGVVPHPALEGVPVSSIDCLSGGERPAGVVTGMHATAVASLIAGKYGSETEGIAPGAKILSVRVLGPDGSGDSFTLAKGIVAAVDAGAKVINMSLGGYGESYVLRQAVQYAVDRGVALVAAAGNDGLSEVTFPARYADVVAVAAIDAAGQHLHVSNRGDEVDVAAPGVAVVAAGAEGKSALVSGTSVAVPFVSGMIAAVLSMDPALSPVQAAGIVIRNVDDYGTPGADESYGMGILDVERILDRDKQGIFDAAVGPASLQGRLADGTLGVVLYVQNRGTEPIRQADLSVEIDGVRSVTALYNVPVGNTVSRVFPIVRERMRGEGKVSVKYSVSLAGQQDSRPYNDGPRLAELAIAVK